MSAISDYKSGPIDLFNTSTGTGLNSIPDYSLDAIVGVKFNTTDGRQVTLVRNAATAIASGKLVQGVAEVTAFEKLAMTVPTAYPATAGTFTVLVTNGATVLNINQFQGGYFVVASGAGIGQTLKIASHQPAANAATFVVTLEDAIQVTLDATSVVSLVANPYISVKITDHTTLSAPIGASLYPIAASTAPTYNGTTGALVTAGTPVYGYIVTHGPTGILVDNTVTNVGYPVGRSAATDGAVGVASLTTAAAVGTSMQTLTSAQVGPIYLNL